jgi:hypothetical protein
MASTSIEAVHDISMSKVVRGITLHVRITGMAVAKARIWLGTRLIVLAAYIIGCGVEVETLDTRSIEDFR